MANPWAGEVGITIDGVPHTLRLTLGALAELEAELGAGSLVELVERFETGKPGTRDILALIVAGLVIGPVAAVLWRGGGFTALSAADVAALRFTIWQAFWSAMVSVVLAVPVARALARQEARKLQSQ